MRAFLLLILCGVACRAEGAFGTWEMNASRSTFSSEHRPKSLPVRIEPDARGEVFTLDKIAEDGRAMTTSTLLYLDGQPRDFHDNERSGTESSRRVDSRTVEILRNCASGAWTRFVRRLAGQPTELILDITEQQLDGRHFERHLVLEKQ